MHLHRSSPFFKPFLLVTGILFLSGIAYSQDVDFFQGSWDQAVKKAKAENKYILVDAYTEWCGPCKRMDAEKFHDNKQVSDLINEHFIAFKADCEKSPAASLALKFKVISYPTLLFFNPEGQLVMRNLGYASDQKIFLQPFQNALDIKSKRVYAYDSKNLSPGFPAVYTDIFKIDNKAPVRHTSEEAIQYLDGSKDKFSEISWAVMLVYYFPGSYQQFFIDNYQKFYSLYADEAADGIRRIAGIYVNKAIKSKSETQLDTAIGLVMRYIPERAPDLVPGWQISFYSNTDQCKKFADAVSVEIEKDPHADIQFTNQFGRAIYQNCDDPEIIKQALGWMDARISDIKNYDTMVTYASLLYKGNRLDEAEEYAMRAINLNESDARSNQNIKDLLVKIKEAKNNVPGR